MEEYLTNKEREDERSFLIFDQFRQTGHLCDAVIHVGNSSFPCHKTILSACSPYFRALFTSWSGTSLGQREVNIPGVSAPSMKTIIDYAYGKACYIGKDVEYILPAADQLNVDGLVSLCIDYLRDELSYENCIGIQRFAREYFFPGLEKDAYKFLMRHFSKVYKVSEEFVRLPFKHLCKILKSDELNVKNEETVFEAILRWIEHRSRRRKYYIDKLLPTIRLGLLDIRYFIDKIQHHKYIRKNKLCKITVVNTLKYLHELDIDDEHFTRKPTPIARPRLPHEILFVMGGWSGVQNNNTMDIYDVRADCWTLSEITETGFANHAVVSIGVCIYLIGGYDGREYFNIVKCFNTETYLWQEMAPMYAKRCYVSAVALRGRLYSMGGFDGRNRLKSAEQYDPDTNQWTLIASMHFQRSDASATGLNNKIYICGGSSGKECFNTAEVYDPSSRQWTLIAPMFNRRSGLCVVAFQGTLYALGGFNGTTRLHTGEMYDPEADKWRPMVSMKQPRSNFSAVVLDGNIFVMGGFNGIRSCTAVECYDAAFEEWYSASDLSTGRTAMSACVVEMFPDVGMFVRANLRWNDFRASGDAHTMWI